MTGSAPPALLICGLFAAGTELLTTAEKRLEAEFGPLVERSPDIPFDFTDYYQSEFGTGLTRRWLGFSPPFAPALLAAAKIMTGHIEQQLTRTDRRLVNIDPGLLTLHNLVLATTKNFAHRIYLRDGIHAELTLIYRHNTWQPLPWTYPDYQTETCHRFLTLSRDRLLKKRLFALSCG